MDKAVVKVFVWLSVLFLGNVSFAWGQANKLKGQILREGSMAPIADAKVFFSARPEVSVQSGAKGDFALPIPPEFRSKTHYTLSMQPAHGDITISQMVNQPLDIFVKLKVKLPEILASVNDEEQETVELVRQNPDILTLPEENLSRKPKMLAVNDKSKTNNPNKTKSNSSTKLESPTSVGNSAKGKASLEKVISMGLDLDSTLSFLPIEDLTAALEDIRQKLILEKEAILKRNNEIQLAIRWVSDQLENNSNLNPQQRQELMAKLEALEEQLEANKLAYNKLQEATHTNIENIKRIISKQGYGFYINYNLIGSLLALILVLALLSYLSNRVARGLRKQRNSLAEKIEQINKQKEEIDNQNVEIREQRDHLKTKNQQLEDLQKSRDQLTAMIAHDLRNPLNIILGYSKNHNKPFALGGLASQESQKYIFQASQRINGLIDNMLDIQKYTKAGIPLQRGSYSIHQVAEKAIQDLLLFADQKGIVVQNEINPLWLVDCDFQVVERVYENLFTNAIKYTPSGGNISFLAKLSEDKTKVILSVQDTGEGIPSDKFSKIFEPFNQLEARRFAHTSSTGLGLTFCKMAIDAHGESLKVKSKLGEGTCFYFTLPCLEVLAEREESIAASEIPEMLSLEKPEENYLRPYKQRLEYLAIYEDSEIRKILSEIDPRGNNTIAQWKTSVQEAVDCLNEKEFQALLSLA